MAERSSLNRFIERFVVPLVSGGSVYVDGLIGPGLISDWAADGTLDGSLVAKVTERVHIRLARVGSVGFADRLAIDSLAIAAVWHNLLAMTHPEARSRKGLRRVVRQWSTSMLEWAGPPSTRAEVSLRHGLFGALGSIGRIDTHVTFWAGYADLVGVSAPRVLVALPTLRRVRQEHTRVGLFGLLAGLEPTATDDADDLYDVVRTALAYSPLTDITLPERPAPMGFSWSPPTINAMGDSALRGVAQRGLLAQGTPAVRAVEQATVELSRRGISAPAALALCRFHVELLLLDALSARAQEGGRPSGVSQPLAMDAFLQLGAERAAMLAGIDPVLVMRAIPVDPSRPIAKDPPSAALLSRAGIMEARS